MKKETPPKWTQPHKSDARKAQSAGSYPDYFSWKTRSGHVLQLDDTKGGETVTLQHRSGTSIQMAHDGSLHITAHNGKYEVTFGEDRMTISGAQDITVKGDASLRVYGDYNVTCHKDYNLTVLGNFNLAAKNHNRHILGNIDTQARNENKKLMGSSSKIARGAIAYVSKGATTIASQSDSLLFGSASGIGMAVKKGNITQNIEEGNFHSETKDGEVHVKSKGKMNYESSEDAIKMTAEKDFGTESKSGNIQAKAESGGIKQEAKNYSGNFTQSAEMITQQKLDLRATGEASLTGSKAHVTGASDVNIKGGAMTNIDGPSGLNLNSLLSIAMPAVNLQIPFDFGQFASDDPKSRGVHAPDKPAGNSETKNWA